MKHDAKRAAAELLIMDIKNSKKIGIRRRALIKI
jgi:hypothetical protein